MSIEAQIWKRYGSKVNTEAMCKFGRTRYSINVFTKVKELKCTNVHGKHIRKDQLLGFSIIMKDGKIEDRVKSKGLYGKDRSHSLTNVGPKY
ncbi:hypothetical protein HanOQP8_Chr14g0520491 [Helianthus annuus]|nr:hypothetical protein HanHA89_Chr14g0559791 [Helianthus annuus]KAJ0655255.1 hypothetical protein HanLR1_Chr14g0522131 [Helianthus annuus]KAJ0658951.1 hypothetical protein HanOQP8_Chr14g0520491 [Helianthus annuus]